MSLVDRIANGIFRSRRRLRDRAVLKKAARARVNADAEKVACCPTCREWFPTTDARNGHRLVAHRRAA